MIISMKHGATQEEKSRKALAILQFLKAAGYRRVLHIETRAVVNAIYKKGNKTFTNTYTVTRKKEMLTAPDEAENETLINDTLAAALQQMLEDGELFTLINSSF